MLVVLMEMLLSMMGLVLMLVLMVLADECWLNDGG